MMVLQNPPIPKPEDLMNAVQKAGAQSINGIFMTLSAPIELVKGLGIPVPELPQLPGQSQGISPPPTGTPLKPLMAVGPFGLPLPFAGGQAEVTYEPYTAENASEGGAEDVTIESGKKKEIWV